MSLATLEQARAAKATLARRVAGHPAVTGVGICGGRAAGYALKLDLREPAADLPDAVDGVPVSVQVVGVVTKRPTS